MTRALVLLVLLLASGMASAHPMDIGYLRIETTGARIDLTLDLDVEVTIAPDVLLAGCEVGPPTETTTGRTRHIVRTARCTSDGSHVLALPWVKTMPARFQLLAQQGESSLGIIDRDHPELTLSTATSHVGFGDFVISGIDHIGAAPSEWRADDGGIKLADGIDHILFVLGLLLGGGTLLRLLGIATGFTVGHSITLALATLAGIAPPPGIVEPLIALSIAFVAIESIVMKWEKHRWKIALGFGLVHGFGFANAISSLQLSLGAKIEALFGFNLGVEVGQLVIIVVLAPLVLAAHRGDKTRRWVLRPIAAAIFVAGMYWFFARL